MRKLSELPAGTKLRAALAFDVLAVLSVGPDGYRVYVGSVPGKNHGDEWEAVAAQGAKQLEEVARGIVAGRFVYEIDIPYVR